MPNLFIFILELFIKWLFQLCMTSLPFLFQMLFHPSDVALGHQASPRRHQEHDCADSRCSASGEVPPHVEPTPHAREIHACGQHEAPSVHAGLELASRACNKFVRPPESPAVPWHRCMATGTNWGQLTEKLASDRHAQVFCGI